MALSDRRGGLCSSGAVCLAPSRAMTQTAADVIVGAGQYTRVLLSAIEAAFGTVMSHRICVGENSPLTEAAERAIVRNDQPLLRGSAGAAAASTDVLERLVGGEK